MTDDLKKLLDRYARAVTEATLAVHIGGKASPLAVHRIELERIARRALEDALLKAKSHA